MNHKAFMRKAIELSFIGMKLGKGGPFGGVVVKDGQIIGEGHNQVLWENDPTAHAEIVAIRAACRKEQNFSLKGATLYASCEPCPMCLSAIYWARIDKIFFANSRHDAASINFDDEWIYKEIALTADLRTIPAKQILREEALEAFTAWKEKSDKIPY